MMERKKEAKKENSNPTVLFHLGIRLLCIHG